jgi:hypothetical protein
MSSSYPTTSDSGIAIGSPTSTATDLSLSFNQVVANPYFYTSFFNAGESLTFSAPFVILQSSGVSISGATISGSGVQSTREAGFVAQFLGTYSQIGFKYTNTNAEPVSFGFTTGVVVAAPAPLPLLGVGVALGQGRKLRSLSNQLRNRGVNAG